MYLPVFYFNSGQLLCYYVGTININFVIMEKKTKIVATIGPASDSEKVLREMMNVGMNVVRINFSHGDHESNGKLINIVKELRREMEIPIGIMADFQGPRIRVGNMEAFTIEKDEIIAVRDKKTEAEKELVVDSPGIVAALKVGERILIEDGLKSLEVISIENNSVKAKVTNGGEIKPRKGINVPDTSLGFGALTVKDEEDLNFALEQGADFVAFSFVSNGQEIKDIREKIKSKLGRVDSLPQIVSKVERKEAIKNIDEIISASDVIMVARGDLGTEMNESKVVIYQKEIIAKCLKAVKPVIVATQMLDSMIENPIPTRAEVSDVSNAVIDHTDAVMLSGESANGKYPIKAVAMMSEIIKNTEESPFDDMTSCEIKGKISDYASIISSVCQLAKNPEIKATVIFSQSGFTAKLMSNHRTKQPIIVATNNQETYQQLAIIWGVEAYFFENDQDRNELINLAIVKAKERGQLQKQDKIVVILGEKSGSEKASMIGIREVE